MAEAFSSVFFRGAIVFEGWREGQGKEISACGFVRTVCEWVGRFLAEVCLVTKARMRKARPSTKASGGNSTTIPRHKNSVLVKTIVISSTRHYNLASFCTLVC